MQDGGLPEVSVDHGATRRFSWTSVQLSEVTDPPVVSPQPSDSRTASPAPPPPPPPLPPPAPVAERRAVRPPVARLRAESDDAGDVTVLGVALVANCHVSLVIFGLFFLAAGTLLCVIAFRAPISALNDYQSRVAGTFFLCLAAVMSTFGLCLCRLDQQQRRRHQENGAADFGDCTIHADTSFCHRVLPSIQRARRSTLFDKRSMLRQLNERWMSADASRHKKSLSSIELLAATSAESLGCGRCNDASSYGTMAKKSDVASFPSADVNGFS